MNAVDGPTPDTEVASPAAARLSVLAGGTPTPTELAALSAALAASVAAQASATATSAPAGPAAWRRAALLEQTRRPRVVRPSDLR